MKSPENSVGPIAAKSSTIPVKNKGSSLSRILNEKDLDELKDYIISLYSKFIPVKALPPELGGKGEARRAEILEEELRKLRLKVERVDAPDNRVPDGYRPNIVALLRGRQDNKTLWIVAHMDTVPEGDISLWKYPPYKVTIEGDYIYGRGVEDDGQAIALALGIAKYLAKKGEKPRINMGIAFVSDEEVGSRYGLLYLLKKNVFTEYSEENYFLVPDAGSPDGSKVIVAEKHILHFKVTVKGKQAHASMPHAGLNAHRLGMIFNLGLDEVLHSTLTEYDELYEPPVSTCEPTRKEENIGNINTIPGTDIVYWDCRILPKRDIKDLIEVLRSYAYHFSSRTRAKAEINVLGYDDAGEPTSIDNEFVKNFLASIEETRGVKPKPIGIGGGTVARYLRKQGYPAIVWMTCDETAHQPNEYTRLSYVLADIETVLYYLLRKA